VLKKHIALSYGVAWNILSGLGPEDPGSKTPEGNFGYESPGSPILQSKMRPANLFALPHFFEKR